MSESNPRPSTIQLDELFAARDGGFVDALRRFSSPKKLESFVEKWKKTPGDWARGQVAVYFDRPLNAPGHEVVVKRLFKHYEELQDDEAVAWCMVAFDRLVRRTRRRSHRYDWQTRQAWIEETLHSPINRTHQEADAKTRQVRNPFTGEMIGAPVRAIRNKPGNRLFSYATRHYLRRRAWRYFRRLGFSQPERYVPALAHALTQYTDDDFTAGENILDNWALMHACFGQHPGLTFTNAYCHLETGQSLSELTPAPYHPEHWQQTEAFDVLMGLLVDARSSLVRLWALEMIKAHHDVLIPSLTPERLIPLFEHPDTRVQGFAGEAFDRLDGLGSLRVEVWLKLLEGTNVAVLSLICESMQKHVSPQRLSNEQLTTLACSRPVPVARMGFELFKARHEERAYPDRELVKLADMQCAAVAGDTAAWVLGLQQEPSDYDLELVSAFFDSSQRTAREAAMVWLDDASQGWNDPRLWARLIETPYDDQRLGVVEKLETRKRMPGTETDKLSHVWLSVVLGVHRGGRRKPDAIRQITRAILEDASKAERLLPVLALAVRSIRGPERRAGLSAIAMLAEHLPELVELVRVTIPELGLLELVAEGGA
ncbi:MAG: hypothetical protein AB8C95_01490 [Phycisphaeraceae bacterium]